MIDSNNDVRSSNTHIQSSNPQNPLHSDIYYPDDNMNEVLEMLNDEDKNKLFQVTHRCFEIIGPEEEEENGEIDVLEEVDIRLPSDKDKFEK